MLEKMMKAAFKTPAGDFEIRETPIPKITQPDYVLAKVKAAGVCGSDMNFWKVPSQFEGMITGHELAGEVIETGPAVKNVKPGDRVAIESLVACGHCYWCDVGQYHLCPELMKIRWDTLSRAFSEYVAGPADNFFKIPDHVPYDEAAILDVYGTSVHACNRTGVRMGQTVVIVGAGPIGLTLLELVNIAGAKAIITGIYDHQLEMAKKLGAYKTINTRLENGLERILDLTGGRGADIVYECVGGKHATKTIQECISYARSGGKVALLGLLEDKLPPFKIDWGKVLLQEIDLVPVMSFAHWGNDREFKIVLDLLIDGRLHAKELITHRFPLEKINEAFDTVANKRETKAIKVVLTM